MPKGSFATMQVETGEPQISFYYESGQVETFSMPISATELAQKLPQLLSQRWVTLHLIDQTVLVCMAKVTKVEVKPPLPQIRDQATFANAQRVTALQRGAAGKIGVQQ
ncbi:hypothetical protein [Arthrospira platensis]|jgi:hypothetical protein|uniref:Uncharacterized protein n=1 Tax=Limnospira platensis NIES-46 TaxID=1236695 RepID=A0A5M3TB13_LIMPL|nr:hypothetical protein [Arthrospira platensis]AMW30932.1 hypothetical protein AP285_26385 [Arthrospira platensis YZ]MBD2667774.1 hypothetical protein [Arthrospira platensis FACHB-439]MBD2711134.1 hypothetical protein [Arthrospira platensis FACHB-835]MDF2208278.1 hypothetical protein [Arthrospira platensis NCB002]MDT9295804.1 hypothetical protein [Arthrospira platensis PCC 7345]QQW28833.1 hypothetical protein AP9108_28980 [Arthrospira sp. PCC 9108]BDT15993.1 hypothetical protein N39L_57160 [